MAHKVAPMLKQMALTDNVAPQIFSRGYPENLLPKSLWEVSPYYASETAMACRENLGIYARICLVTPYP